MITLSEYASFDSVRAALGVSVKEIPDVVLSSDIYAFFVQQELDEISATLRTEFEAITPPGVSDTEKELYDTVRVFSAYAVAYKASDSLALSAPKTIEEGKAAVSRFADSPYKNVVIEVRKSYIQYKKILQTLIDDEETSVLVPTLMSGVTPDFDPVTGA